METTNDFGNTTAGLNVFDTKGLGGHEDRIEAVRTKAAELWDLFNNNGVPEKVSSDAARMFSLAKTNLEQAIMWFTKGTSRSST